MQTNLQKMADLVQLLNYYTEQYDKGHPEISDEAWDKLYFKLVALECKSGYYFKNSPTHSITFNIVSQLNKIEHNHPMLSLEKTKNINDVVQFLGKSNWIAMAKMDGLTCSLTYENGQLVRAETRGDGFIGEDILHNALANITIPKRIPYKDKFIVDGEIICTYKNFQKHSDEFSHPRSYAAGSIRLLDSKESAKRDLTFVVWDVITPIEIPAVENNLSNQLSYISHWGFTIVPFVYYNKDILDEEYNSTIEEALEKIPNYCSEDLSYPIDGIVFKFDDISLREKLGNTAHHFKNAIAYKFYDETYDTILRDIDWSMSRTGRLNPVAIFEPVEMDGAIVERASLHNLTIMKELLNEPWCGQPITVYRANMIIPQIQSGDKILKPKHKDDYFVAPTKCPVCGEPLQIKQENNSAFLECVNPACEGKFINQLDHFCSKKGLDIKGLSLATLEKLVDWEWVKEIPDLYSLKNYRLEWIKRAGFGKKSVDNILQAIEDSRNCSLEAFLSAIGIPLVGRNVAKELIKHFSTYDEFRQAIKDNYNFSEIEGFAIGKKSAILNFDYTIADKLAHEELNIQKVEEQEEKDKLLEGKKYVITGTVKKFKNRAELQKFIEERGGKVVSSISKNVDYLINNNINSTSAKNLSAKKMEIPIITEDDFLAELD